MFKLNLSPGEFVLAELDGLIESGGRFRSQTGKLVATNKNIFWVRNGALGNPKDAVAWSLKDLVIFNDVAQIKVSTKNGLAVFVDLYFTTGQHSFQSTGIIDTSAARDFANAVNHIVTGSEVDIYSSIEEQPQKKGLLKSLFSESNVEVKRADKTKVAISCNACGGSFVAIKGHIAKCPYCGNVYNA